MPNELTPREEELQTLAMTVAVDGATLDAPPSETVGAPEAPPPEVVPDAFPLEKLLGEGGMGQVFRAQQTSLRRAVAVKTVRAAKRANPLVEAQFLSEALVTGELEHPNIVPVHELGRTPDGQPFLAMKLVRGAEWADLVGSAETTLREHLDILVKVCDAMAFAHSRGILHRDLKPRNVMVGEFGEVLVMDWGLALDVTEPPPPKGKALHRTGVRAAAGTPAYMPPELALPLPERIGPASDVYLLGAILYEVLTGAPPHRGKTSMEMLGRAREGVVEAPEVRAPQRRIPAELARIAMRALAADPRERTPTAAELKRELTEFLSHQESLRLAEDAERELARLEKPGAVPREDRYACYADALSRLGEALHLWPANAAAQATRGRASLAYADEALDRGDFGLAAAQVHVMDATPGLPPARVAAVRAALDAHASARKRTRLALGCALAALAAVYAALGGTWRELTAEEHRGRMEARLRTALDHAWTAVRRADLAELAGAERELGDPALAGLPDQPRGAGDVAFARAILLWQRGRWEELLELASAHTAIPGLTQLGRAAADGRPAARVERELAAAEADGRKYHAAPTAGSADEPPRALRWTTLARAALLSLARRRPALPFVLRAGAAQRDDARRAGDAGAAEGWPDRLVLHDATRHGWSCRDARDDRELWAYAPSRPGMAVDLAVPDDAGGVVLASSGQVVRTELADGCVTARAMLRGHPVLAWPDPVEPSQLVVLVADDATTAGGRGAGDHSGREPPVFEGGAFSSGTPTLTGCGRVRELRPALEALPAGTEARALAQALALIPPVALRPGATEAQEHAHRRRERLAHLVGDPGDAHAALLTLRQDSEALTPAAREAVARLALAASPRLIPEEELGAAAVFDSLDRTEAARALADEAGRRFLAGGGNPELGGPTLAGALSRNFVVWAANHAGPQRAQELLEVALCFASQHPADPAVTVAIARALNPGAKQPDLDVPELRGEATSLDDQLSSWGVAANRLVVVTLAAAIFLAVVIARRAKPTQRADLHAIGMRTSRERLTGFFMHPFHRLRHISLAYATRFERLVLGLAGGAFLLALGSAVAVARLEPELRLLADHPAASVEGGGDVLALLEARRARHATPAVLQLLADAYRARGDRAAAAQALALIAAADPADSRAQNDLAVLSEEAGQDATEAYERAAAAPDAAAARWNRARGRDAAARAAAEAELPPALRRTARALAAVRAHPAPLWLPARAADVQAAAFDGAAVKHQLVAGLVGALFRPADLYDAIEESLAGDDPGWWGVLSRGFAAALATFAIVLAYVTLCAGALALVWLPLPVRGLAELPPGPAAPPRGFVRRAYARLGRVAGGAVIDAAHRAVLVADPFFPGVQDLVDGRAAAGVLKLMLVAGGVAVAGVAGAASSGATGSAVATWLTGGSPPGLALAGELAQALVALVYLANLGPSLARLHRAGATRPGAFLADAQLLPGHLVRLLASAARQRRPLSDAVRAFVTHHAMYARDRRDLRRLAADLDAGQPLPAALAGQRLFPAWAAPLLGAGAAAGRLEEALDTAAALLSFGRRLQQRLQTALAAPLVELAALLFLCGLVAPLLAESVTGVIARHGAVPPALAAIDGASPALELAAAAVFVLLLAVSGAPLPGRRFWDWAADRVLPPRRRALAAMQEAAAARLLAAALDVNTPLPAALAAVAPLVRGPALARRLADAARRVEAGEPPARALAPAGEREAPWLFEASGALSGKDAPGRLRELAERREREALDEATRLPALLVPAVTLLTGALVLAVLGGFIQVLSTLSAEVTRAFAG